MKLNKRSCKHCGDIFQKEKPLQYCCSVKCSIAYAKVQETNKKYKDWLHRKNDLKKSLETKSDVIKTLQGLTNELIRLIDYGQLCISSQRTPLKINSGHFYSVGAHPKLRFNLFNIFVQSEKDNSYLSGNQLNYMINLGVVFGENVKEQILGLPLKCENVNLDIDDLKKAIAKTRECIKLHKQDYQKVKLKSMERLSVRQFYQKKIGLYPGLNKY